MDILSVIVVVLALVVIALLFVVLALARQVGILFERVAPMGALMTDAGLRSAKIRRVRTDDARRQGIDARRPQPASTLVFFLSTTCPVCKKLIPVLRSLRQAEETASTSCWPVTARPACTRRSGARRTSATFPTFCRRISA
jgi:methylamine dehydrogenase accessory protein MauD